MRFPFASLLAALVLCLGNAVAVAQEYDVQPVVYKNLVANLYLPRTTGKVPLVIAFGGSDPGLNTGNANGEMLAPHGVAVLALAFFGAKGLPPTLDQIPLEYFVQALDFVATVPALDAARIGVVSGSRGSEAALLLATRDTRVRSVVVTTPSSVAWQGMTLARSAWTVRGSDVPALALELDEKAAKLARFSAALANREYVQKALFQFEKINGPVLLISASKDQIWPSTRMAADIQAYLVGHDFRFPVTHTSYNTGHGFSKETAPEIKQAIIAHFVRTLAAAH